MYSCIGYDLVHHGIIYSWSNANPWISGSHQIDSRLTIPVDKELTPSSTGRRSKSPRQRVGTPSAENGEQANTGSMQPHTLAAHTNLSRLAEIATSQPTAAPKLQTPDVHQPPGVLPGQHISQVHSQLLAAQARYLTPGQNISLPVGLLQQNHFPIYSGYQHVPAGSVFQQVPGQMAAMPLPQGQYPPPFMKGSIIQLASGDLKRVEDLMTEDFVQSTKLCPDLKLETSTVVLVNENAEGGIAMVTFSVDSTKQQVCKKHQLCFSTYAPLFKSWLALTQQKTFIPHVFVFVS